MPQPIGPLNRTPGLAGVSPVDRRPPATGAAPSFGEGLGKLVSQVNDVQHQATDAINRLATGDGENLHEVMLAVSKAELSFNFVMEARNKLVEAYQEVMRMSL